ncbi:MAG: DUF488 domain-containing protein [Bacteroidetes bacterium]|nr:DUF488 domain-containing protein [Bacteroidota bacterium]
MIKIKRIYEVPEPEDGYRMLVDRLWPRGVSKQEAGIDEWNKDIAPSTELRKWFGHKPELFQAFADRYKVELSTKTDELRRIRSIGQRQHLTLLYAAKDPHFNQATVLSEVLDQLP